MSRIDPTARIDDGAVIGADCTIGPFCIVGSHATLGAGTTLLSHVSVVGHTTLGENCVVHPFAVLGGAPQDLSYRGEPTRLEIGDRCTIREGSTMNVGTLKGGGITRVGHDGLFMNNSHVAHDCTVGNNAIFATSATLGGHCEIGDAVYLGGLSAVHQFTRIGRGVMVGGVCGVRGDIIPYGLANGQYAALEGLNLIGMKRRGFTRERVAAVRRFYQALFYGEGVFADRLARAQSSAADDPAIAEILAFIGAGAHRALCKPAASTGPN